MKATPRPPFQASTLALEPELSLLEALAAVEFLNKRRVLCTSCGYRKSVAENQIQAHCEACKRPQGSYNGVVPKATELDLILCERVQRWSERFIHAPEVKGDAPDPGNASGGAGKT